MTTNINDITLQSTDGVLVARNEQGHLTYPMLFLDREPIPSDVQGWDRVLVLIDSDGGMSVSPTVIELTEENNSFQSLSIQGEGAWSISGVTDELIQLESSSGQMAGVGNARMDITKAAGLTGQGGYSTFFTVTNSNGTEIRVDVYITVNRPMTVDGTGNGGTLNITLNQGNNYTQTLTILRDREWTAEGIDTNIINVTPTSGSGANMPDFISTLTVTKSPLLTAPGTTTTTLTVVSGYQTVYVTVTLIIPVTADWDDPISGNSEAGVTGTGNIYLYL